MTVLGHRGQGDRQAAGKACFQAMAGPSIIASVWCAGTGHSLTHPGVRRFAMATVECAGVRQGVPYRMSKPGIRIKSVTICHKARRLLKDKSLKYPNK